MNKKRILIQNVIFFVVSAIIYLTSFLLVYNMTNNETVDSLISYSQQVSSELVSEANADDVIIKFSLIDNFRVSIYEEDVDKPIADTRAFPSLEGGFEMIKSNLDKIYYQRSDTLSTDMIYYATYDTDSNLYIRVGFPLSDTQKYTMYMLYFGLSGFFLLDMVFLIYSYLNFKKSLEPLKLATSRIQAIVGKEKPISNKPKDDLNILSSSIDEVGYEFEKQLNETKESRQKLDFIINSMTQGIVVIDANFNIIMINDSAANLLKLNKDKVLNDIYSKYILKDSKLDKGINEVVKTANYTRFDEKIDDRDYMFEISSIDYQWTKGVNKHGCLVFMYDITSQKNADEMQREFFANTSHELKSPLTSILGYQEMIKEGIITSDEELKDANDRTLKEAQRMKGIVKYMLENSRNLDVISVSEHNVKKYVNVILDSLAFEINERRLKVETKLDDLVVKINHDDLDKLIRNLVTNAIKYNKLGGKLIVTVNASDKSLSVSDTGVGIKQSEVDKIFERFYMVDKGRNRENDSSGIGLSIVKDICNYYNLKIEVHSELDKGSTFTIFFK
jgi:Signal transduction histidine kinase